MRRKKNPILIPEKPFSYSWKEYEAWTNEDDIIREAKIKSLLKVSGYLGKNKSNFFNQAKPGKGKQHFPEVKYAGHLVKNEGFQKKYLTLEKFTFSLSEADRIINLFDPKLFFKNSLNEDLKEDFMRARGTYKLREVFNNIFWRKFEQLYKKNIYRINKPLEKINVDLCTINHDNQIVQFCEFKKYDLGSNKTEILTNDQLCVLTFIRYIVDTFKDDIFVGNHYDVITELVVFIPKQDKKLLERMMINPLRHPVPCRT
jgi:hypothetical protein